MRESDGFICSGKNTAILLGTFFYGAPRISLWPLWISAGHLLAVLHVHKIRGELGGKAFV